MKASPKTIKIIVKMTYAVSALGSVFMIAIGDYWGAFALAFIGLSFFSPPKAISGALDTVKSMRGVTFKWKVEHV